ncbi:hypothetical protein CR513_23010, partial [Mucuna pruriens]
CKVSGKENQDLTALFSGLLALMEDVCIVESGPYMGRKDAYMIVRHIKYGLSKKKKGGKKLQDATHVNTQEGDMETLTGNSSDSIECESESDAESGFETEEEEEEVLFDSDKLWKSSSPNNQTSADPEAAFLSRSNDPVSPPLSENRYRRTNHHGENQFQFNAQVPPAVAENRYKRVEPRNRFQQTSNNTGTRDVVRPTPPNWNRTTRHARADFNVNPRIENDRQAFTPPGSRHSMPPPNAPRPFSGPNEGIPKHPGAPNTSRPSSYGIFSTPKAGMHRNSK